MNKRASVLLALLMSCSSLVLRNDTKLTVELDDQRYDSVENQKFYTVTNPLKVNVTEKFRLYLKAELGVLNEEPKSFYQLSFYELVNNVNPWGYKNPVDACNDQIICLLQLLIKQKYENVMAYTINSAASYGIQISESIMILLFISALWPLKKLTGFVMAISKNMIESLRYGILRNVKFLYSLICVLVRIIFKKIRQIPTKIRAVITTVVLKVMTIFKRETPYQNEMLLEENLEVLENKKIIEEKITTSNPKSVITSGNPEPIISCSPKQKVSGISKPKVICTPKPKACRPSKIPKWDGINVGSKDHEVAHYIYVYAETLGSKIPRLNALKEKLY